MESSFPLPDDIAQYIERITSEGDRIGYIRTLPYDYEILVENLLDPAHFPFSHHGAGSNVKRSNAAALRMTQVPSVTPNAMASAKYTETASGKPFSSFLEFVNPAFVTYIYPSRDTEESDGSILLLPVPVRKGQCRILIKSIPVGGVSGDKIKMSIPMKLMSLTPEILHVWRNNILDGDSVFLHLQDQILRKEMKNGWSPNTYFTPTSADFMVVNFRNWLRKEGGGGPFGPSENQGTSSIPRRELLDRYKSYTLLSKEAQKALAFVNRSIAAFKMLGNVFLLMGGALVVHSMQKGVMFMWQTVACLSAFALCLFLQRFLCNKILSLFHFIDYVHAEKN